jgi:predicted N-acetyltransferase YhbS
LYLPKDGRMLLASVYNMAEIIVRNAKPEDASAIGRLLMERLPFPIETMGMAVANLFSLKRLDQKLHRRREKNVGLAIDVRGRVSLVAEKEGTIVGVVQAREVVNKNGAKQFWAHNFAVSRGSNAGRALYNELLKEAAQRGFDHIYFDHSPKVTRQYRRFGAEQVGLLRGFVTSRIAVKPKERAVTQSK